MTFFRFCILPLSMATVLLPCSGGGIRATASAVAAAGGGELVAPARDSVVGKRIPTVTALPPPLLLPPPAAACFASGLGGCEAKPMADLRPRPPSETTGAAVLPSALVVSTFLVGRLLVLVLDWERCRSAATCGGRGSNSN